MTYQCIAADPPWMERGGGKIKRGADRHYPLMPANDIAELMASLPAVSLASRSDCHLWLWATSNHLPDAFSVANQLGARYITHSVWVKMKDGKVQIGLGQYMRHAHEHLLLCAWGKLPVPTPENRKSSVIIAPRTRHSQKPDEAYDLIERISPGPRLELFARTARPGWDVWGNETVDTQEPTP